MALKLRAQNIGEYAIVIAIVGAALVVMQQYLVRSVQGVIKLSIDEVGHQKRDGFNITEGAELYSKSAKTETTSTTKTVQHRLMNISQTGEIKTADLYPEEDYLQYNVEFTGSSLKDLEE